MSCPECVTRFTCLMRGRCGLEGKQEIVAPAELPGIGAGSPGVRFDTGKARVDLLDTEFLEQIGKVLAFGAGKYDEHNWRKGIAVSRNIAAALRHTFAAMRGEDTDPESGLPHLAHAACDLMFAWWTIRHRPKFDDRWRDGGNT